LKVLFVFGDFGVKFGIKSVVFGTSDSSVFSLKSRLLASGAPARMIVLFINGVLPWWYEGMVLESIKAKFGSTRLARLLDGKIDAKRERTPRDTSNECRCCIYYLTRAVLVDVAK
jgi:hypothetical protein